MNYLELKRETLPALADVAINPDSAIAPRLSAFEMLCARVSEIPEIWCGLTESERAGIRAAYALDLAADGFTADAEEIPEADAEEKPDALAEMYAEMSHASHDSYIKSLCS